MAKLTLVECVERGLRMRVNINVVKGCHCDGALKPAEKIVFKDPSRKRKNRRAGIGASV